MVHGEADVPLIAELRVAGVEAHTNAHRCVGRPCMTAVDALRRRRRCHRVPAAPEDGETRVALHVDDHAVRLLDRVPEQPPVDP